MDITEQIIQTYNRVKHVKKTALELNLKPYTVTKVLKENNIPRLGMKKYEMDNTFFDKIDTEEKAYFLGMLWTDGHNNQDGAISIFLQERDVDILQRMKKAIKSTRPLWRHENPHQIDGYDSSPQYGLILSNKVMSDKLKHVGMNHNKTYTLRIPFEYIPQHLMRHFIRGCWDGDGCIYTRYENNTPRQSVLYFLAKNRDFALDVQRAILDGSGETLKIELVKSKDMVRLTGQRIMQVKNILDWMYKDSTIYLDRKYSKYGECIVVYNRIMSNRNKI